MTYLTTKNQQTNLKKDRQIEHKHKIKDFARNMIQILNLK